MSSLDTLPAPDPTRGYRTLREHNEYLEDGDADCLVIDEAQIYPTIQVKNGDIIKPTVTNEKVDNIFITRDETLRKRFVRCLRVNGLIPSLEMIRDYDNYVNIENSRLIRFNQIIAGFILHLWQLLLNFYVFIYPFALHSNEELGQEFSKSMDWKKGLIRTFEWHPEGLKCAVCHINDCIYIYSANTSLIALLKHINQSKVMAMSWSPTREEILVVCCQSAIIIWTVDSNSQQLRPKSESIRIINKGFKSPLTDLSFDPSGQFLVACSPQSSMLYIIDIDKLSIDKTIRRFGVCFTRLFWSPDGNRLMTSTTGHYICVFETKNWSSAKWSENFSDICQTACWSRPNGRILLFTSRDNPTVFAIPFYDSPQPNDVGGTRKCLEVLDLSERQFPNGVKVGGNIHQMIWDKNSERLAISFKDNNEYIALYKTVIRSNLEVTPIGFIHGVSTEIPLVLTFHNTFRSGSLLTICWNSGVVSYIPLQFDSKANKSMYTKGTPRPLTSFCVTSPNVSIQSHGTSFRGTPFRMSTTFNSPVNHLNPNDSVLSPKRPLLFTQLANNSLHDTSYNSLQ
ncbi:aladin-like [Oppia nitens]|uniref:aladin-like n=1 Tax=Oppia nitens TaxID=1686743 RepID=UPI0023DA1C84|nr:aladin-like [Oppia nitens]